MWKSYEKQVMKWKYESSKRRIPVRVTSVGWRDRQVNLSKYTNSKTYSNRRIYCEQWTNVSSDFLGKIPKQLLKFNF